MECRVSLALRSLIAVGYSDLGSLFPPMTPFKLNTAALFGYIIPKLLSCFEKGMFYVIIVAEVSLLVAVAVSREES